MLNTLELLEFGPLFDSEGGILTELPPLLGPSYKIFVPKPDNDGLDIAGIRPMEIRAPLVSYELTRDNTCEESCGRGGGGVQPWAC